MIPPTISADDRGLLLGVGLFETVLFVDGEPRLWEAHVQRLRAGCGELRLPAPKAGVLLATAREALATDRLAAGRSVVRLTWTGGGGGRGLDGPADPGPGLLVSSAPAPEPPGALSLATSRVRRNPTSPTSRLKTLSYLDNVTARREARAAGADEALCLDTAGRVACAAAGNLFWLEGERLCTPSPSCGVLPGVMRAEVLRLASALGWRAALVEAEPARLIAADAVFVTNSLIGAAPAASLDGRRLRTRPGALRNLQARLPA